VCLYPTLLYLLNLVGLYSSGLKQGNTNLVEPETVIIE